MMLTGETSMSEAARWERGRKSRFDYMFFRLFCSFAFSVSLFSHCTESFAAREYSRTLRGLSYNSVEERDNNRISLPGTAGGPSTGFDVLTQVPDSSYRDLDGPLRSKDSLVPKSGSGIGNVHLFQGRRFDPETGLYYFRNRYYDPSSGRFLQRDGIWDAKNVGNAYTFVSNGPTTRQDPSGLQERAGIGDILKSAITGQPMRPLRRPPSRSQQRLVGPAATLRSAEPVVRTIIGEGLDFLLPEFVARRQVMMDLGRWNEEQLRDRIEGIAKEKWSKIDKEERERIEQFSNTSLHKEYCEKVEYFSGGRIKEEDAHRMNPWGGLTGPDEAVYLPKSALGIGAHAIRHDALGFLGTEFRAGPGYGLLGRDNMYRGQVSGILRNVLQAPLHFLSDPHFDESKLMNP